MKIRVARTAKEILHMFTCQTDSCMQVAVDKTGIDPLPCAISISSSSGSNVDEFFASRGYHKSVFYARNPYTYGVYADENGEIAARSIVHLDQNLRPHVYGSVYQTIDDEDFGGRGIKAIADYMASIKIPPIRTCINCAFPLTWEMAPFVGPDGEKYMPIAHCDDINHIYAHYNKRTNRIVVGAKTARNASLSTYTGNGWLNIGYLPCVT